MSKLTDADILASLRMKPLSGTANYRKWRLAIVDLLAEKGYLEIVSGEWKRPDDISAESTTGGTAAATASSARRTTDSARETAEAISKWKGKPSKARGMLGLLLDSAHRELYAGVRDPKALWDRLEKRYAGKD